MEKPGNLFFESLGCPKNRVDSEIIIGTLLEKGWVITEVPSLADLIVINSCGFTQEAREETVAKFFELNSLKKENSMIVLAGCLVQLYPEIKNMLPEADLIAGIDDIPRFSEILANNSQNNCPETNDPTYIGNSQTPRVLTLSPFTAYVKIADGCDNYCSYCSIPFIRGKYRERPVGDIVKEVEILVSNGVKEIVLISQDTTKYGLTVNSSLKELLEEINMVPGRFKARVMYFHPSGVTPELVSAIDELEKIVPYFEIPVQHINTKVLECMNRRYGRKKIEEIIELIKSICGNNYVLRTTFISSFPKETEKDHKEMIDFIKKGYFDYAGVFKYSKEEKTESYKMRAVASKRAEARFKEAEKEAYLSMEKKLDRFTGVEMEILYEGIDPELEVPVGRGWHQAPEIDGITIITDIGKEKPGQYVKCRIIDRDGVDFVAELI